MAMALNIKNTIDQYDSYGIYALTSTLEVVERGLFNAYILTIIILVPLA